MYRYNHVFLFCSPLTLKFRILTLRGACPISSSSLALGFSTANKQFPWPCKLNPIRQHLHYPQRLHNRISTPPYPPLLLKFFFSSSTTSPQPQPALSPLTSRRSTALTLLQTTIHTLIVQEDTICTVLTQQSTIHTSQTHTRTNSVEPKTVIQLPNI